MSNKNLKFNTYDQITDLDFLPPPNQLLLQLPSLNLNHLKLEIQELSLIIFSFTLSSLLYRCSFLYIYYINNFQKLTVNDNHLHTWYMIPIVLSHIVFHIFLTVALLEI